jgi:hypothetical protein
MVTCASFSWSDSITCPTPGQNDLFLVTGLFTQTETVLKKLSGNGGWFPPRTLHPGSGIAIEPTCGLRGQNKYEASHDTISTLV